MQRFFIVLGISLLFVVPIVGSIPAQVHAEEMSLSQLVELFISLGIIPADKAVAARSALSQTAATPKAGSVSCFDITHDFSLGTSDSTTSGDVTRIQKYLIYTGDFTGQATGYFGPLTQAALKRWQLAHAIADASFGSGFGSVGPRTRGAMACKPSLSNMTTSGVSTTQPAKPTQMMSQQSAAINESSLTATSGNPTITGTANGVTGVSFLLTDATSKIYDILYPNIPVTQGQWAFYLNGTPLTPGVYYVSISAPSGEILVQSKKLTVTYPTSNTSLGSASIIASNPSAAAVQVTYANIPNTVNTYAFIFLPSSDPTNWYHTSGTVTGSGTITLSIPPDMPAGIYRVRIFNQWVGGVAASLAESNPFTIYK